ncbi:Asp-tRNA(Asn)/Glu-tRNA(Gln) amidotransferase subunit GatB [Tessaracoccus antarcticus]|uniref:Aspartyl/glutamyl-tRNA(Asn/Gln) amidotransferase subunit B n=1 Tax=Tessaracoccus antarcticus TaxID=2479848 RepID=A0A3M0GND1_9ACTN|nr:Asp-tRNA(Asn)/Glu-tRNA(Gln) amidotransferase subunit GatB [Tessaracoccus antarcticus]RMB58796.1 Asp-tRNA(Asn)/Glu-tRNA(Gln) amidotransferase subunit GatB [Tessaracoccus antarcticus]
MTEILDYDDVLESFDPAIGLEVHVELSTASKMFCGCSTTFGAEPNSQTCPVCLGLPGSLPVVNAKAVESAIRIGLALNCQIAPWGRFARKNYFYPDMTKNFQTSQYDEPIAHDGWVDLEVEGEMFRIEVERAHMEEDAGKLTHVGTSGRIHGAEYSLLDYNRAGTPLIEIVTRPILGTGAKAPQVAKAYVSHLRDLMRALKVSDVRMEHGSLRCDANISLAHKGAQELGIRTETKNVNSLRSVERAITFEMRRQGALLLDGGRVKQETRHFDEATGTTRSGRSKEEAQDYRYFAEPDLVPIAPSAEWIEELRATLPEQPVARRKRLATEWDADELAMRDIVAVGAMDMIEETVAAGAPPQAARKWWVGELARRANEGGVELEELPITPRDVAEVCALVVSGELNDKLARQVFEGVLAGEGSAREVVDARGLAIVSDDGALKEAVDKAIAANPDVAARIRDGKHQAIGALIGQVMKAMRGQADAGRVRELVLEELG